MIDRPMINRAMMSCPMIGRLMISHQLRPFATLLPLAVPVW